MFRVFWSKIFYQQTFTFFCTNISTIIDGSILVHINFKVITVVKPNFTKLVQKSCLSQEVTCSRLSFSEEFLGKTLKSILNMTAALLKIFWRLFRHLVCFIFFGQKTFGRMTFGQCKEKISTIGCWSNGGAKHCVGQMPVDQIFFAQMPGGQMPDGQMPDDWMPDGCCWPNICQLNACWPNICWANICWANICWPNVRWQNICLPNITP